MNEDAEAARSILACAVEVEIAVAGVRSPLGDTPLGLQDWAGVPAFVCAPGGPLARAGEGRRNALLSVSSDLRAGDVLLLAGQLRHAGSDTCPCCSDDRDYVVVDLTSVVLARHDGRTPIEVGDFRDPALQLNTGFLRRNEEHLNTDHGEDLRRTIARRTNTLLDRIVAAQIAALSPTGVELQWVTGEGAHSLPLMFPEAARNADELGLSLQRALHLDAC